MQNKSHGSTCHETSSFHEETLATSTVNGKLLVCHKHESLRSLLIHCILGLHMTSEKLKLKTLSFTLACFVLKIEQFECRFFFTMRDICIASERHVMFTKIFDTLFIYYSSSIILQFVDLIY